MPLEQNQLPEAYRNVINDQIKIYDDGRSITVRNSIPLTGEIPIENPKVWLKIPDVICVFVDMKNSTNLSANHKDNQTAGAYQLFTATAVRLFDMFDAAYIDVRGDGAFALFNSDSPYTALAAAISFKTFADLEFVPRIKKLTEVEVGCHIGIDQKTVLVRKIGMKRVEGRTDRQNEVWAGKPVNMAAKLSSMSEHNELLASERFFKNIKDEHALKSCGCPNGTKTELWAETDVAANPMFDFAKAYSIKTNWCKVHGKEYCDRIVALDAKT